jgi:ubiquinone/menaquinone biosynthesis C-methylase UbiE
MKISQAMFDINYLEIVDRMFKPTILNHENIHNLEIALQDREMVLELAVGLGNLAEKLLSTYHSMDFYGIDINLAAIEYCSKKLQPHQKRAALQVMDAKSLEYSASFFDAVVCNTSLGEIGSVEQVLRETYRVLKAGGVFVLACSGKDAEKKMVEEFNNGGCQHPETGCTSEELQYLKKYPVLQRCLQYTFDDLKADFEKAGFVKPANVTYYYHNTCTLCTIEK